MFYLSVKLGLREVTYERITQGLWITEFAENVWTYETGSTCWMGTFYRPIHPAQKWVKMFRTEK
jgi:hypothetical protein